MEPVTLDLGDRDPRGGEAAFDTGICEMLDRWALPLVLATIGSEDSRLGARTMAVTPLSCTESPCDIDTAVAVLSRCFLLSCSRVVLPQALLLPSSRDFRLGPNYSLRSPVTALRGKRLVHV